MTINSRSPHDEPAPDERTRLLVGQHRPDNQNRQARSLTCRQSAQDNEIDTDESASPSDLIPGDGFAPAPVPDAAAREDPEVGPVAADESSRRYLINTNPRKFWTLFPLIMLTYFIALFDSTIMASSYAIITSDFHASNSASWLSTAFLLTNTAIQPVQSRLSDAIGRKPVYIAAMALLAAATVWCALAESMESLIAARAVCGLGAGGMMGMGITMIGDMIPSERRAPYQSSINVIYGLAAASGAALGGILGDKLGWRWIFGIQVPYLLVCLALALFIVPRDIGVQGKERETFMEAMKTFDFRGSCLLTMSTTFLILGLSLGGNVLPWSHPFIIISLIMFTICFPACLWAETRAQRPVLPLVVLKTSPRANILFSNLLASMLLNAILFNVPLFFQAVLLSTATDSGLRLMVPTATASIFGISVGWLVPRTRRLKWPLVTGALATLAGTAALSTQLRRGRPGWVYLACLVPGAVGQGLQFPTTQLALYAASAPAENSYISSTLSMFRALGSVLGVAGSSLVLQNALLRYLRLYVVVDGSHSEAWKEQLIETVRRSVEAVAELEGPVRDQVVASYEAAVRSMFLCCIVVAAVSVLLLLPIKLPKYSRR